MTPSKPPLAAQMVKRPPAMRETRVQALGWEDLLEKEMATHSSILAREIPRTEEPGRPQSWKATDTTELHAPQCTYVNLHLPVHLPPLPLGVHPCVLYTSVSISALQIRSSIPLFLIPHICINIYLFFSS